MTIFLTLRLSRNFKFPPLWTRPPVGWHSVVNLFFAYRVCILRQLGVL